MGPLARQSFCSLSHFWAPLYYLRSSSVDHACKFLSVCRSQKMRINPSVDKNSAILFYFSASIFTLRYMSTNTMYKSYCLPFAQVSEGMFRSRILVSPQNKLTSSKKEIGCSTLAFGLCYYWVSRLPRLLLGFAFANYELRHFWNHGASGDIFDIKLQAVSAQEIIGVWHTQQGPSVIIIIELHNFVAHGCFFILFIIHF